MKKVFVILASLLLMIGISSCNSCSRPASGNVAAADSVLVDSSFVEEVATDAASADTTALDSLNLGTPLGE